MEATRPKWGTPEWEAYEAKIRRHLENSMGQVWNTAQVEKDFKVIAFSAPYVVVVRKSDNVRGTLMFNHSPRLYFDFKETNQ